MESKEAEVQEITVLTDEQIAQLPAKAKKNILSLTENMRNKELMVLNPLVTRLLDLRDRAANLKVEKDEEGNITNLQEYKDLKSEQRTFNGDTTREFKAMKAPYLEVQKGLVSVETVFKDVSNTEVKAKAEEVFAEYEAEKAKKAEEAQKAKDAATRQQIEEATNEAAALREQSEKSNTINTIKYTQIAENITQKASDAVLTMNKGSLISLKSEIEAKTFDTITANQPMDKLDSQVTEELKLQFTVARKKAIDLIDDKLKSIQNEETVSRYTAGPTANNYPEFGSKIGYHPVARNEDVAPADPDVPTSTIKSLKLTEKAGDTTYDSFIAVGWTDESLVEHGYAVWEEQVINGHPSPVDVGQVEDKPNSIAIELKERSDEEMIKYIMVRIDGMEGALDYRIKTKGITPELADLKQKFIKFREA